jgi:hypothetical protein
MGRPRLQRRRSQIMGRLQHHRSDRSKLRRHRLRRSKGRALTAKLIEGLSNKPFAGMRNCPAKIGCYKTSIPKSLVVYLAKREPILIQAENGWVTQRNQCRDPRHDRLLSAKLRRAYSRA